MTRLNKGSELNLTGGKLT